MASTVHHQDEQITLHLGDCLDVLPTLPGNSVDAVVCDPPYSLPGGFMGKEWDRHDSPRAFQAWCTAWARECLRVLKPGGHLLAFGAPRTYHRLAAGIEDAGFEIRDSIHWIFGSGFPKGQDIGKSIDRRRFASGDFAAFKQALAQAVAACGKTRQQINAECGFTMRFDIAYEKDPVGWGCSLPSPQQYDVIVRVLGGGLREWPRERFEAVYRVVGFEDRFNAPSGIVSAGRASVPVRREITAPESAQARAWEGWNTALKPAHEPIIVARKSTGFNTTVANVLEHGTGALNIDACRVGLNGEKAPTGSGDRRGSSTYAQDAWTRTSMTNGGNETPDAGRWPANLVLTHAPGCREVGTRTVRNPSGSVTGEEPSALVDAVYAERKRVPYEARETETVPVWDCQPGCPVAELDRQSGVLKSGVLAPHHDAKPSKNTSMGGANYAGRVKRTFGGDEGGASRFFPIFRYEAKAPASERPRLADGTVHATVKPLDLMRWLVRLVTPPGGTVLDPFAGSGTTGEAAIIEGFNVLLIERERPYADLIVARLSKPLQPTLFGEAA